AARPGDSGWTVRSGDTLVLGRPVVNAFGGAEGGLALAYATATTEARLGALTLSLGGAGIVILLLGLDVAGALAGRMLRPIQDDLEQARTRLGTLSAGIVPPGPVPAALPWLGTLAGAGRAALS